MPEPKSPKQLADQDIQQLEYRIAMLEEELRVMSPDMGSIEAYRLKDAEHTQRLTELEALTAERDQVLETTSRLPCRRSSCCRQAVGHCAGARCRFSC